MITIDALCLSLSLSLSPSSPDPRTDDIAWEPPLQYDENGILINGLAHLIGGRHGSARVLPLAVERQQKSGAGFAVP